MEALHILVNLHSFHLFISLFYIFTDFCRRVFHWTVSPTANDHQIRGKPRPCEHYFCSLQLGFTLVSPLSHHLSHVSYATWLLGLADYQQEVRYLGPCTCVSKIFKLRIAIFPAIWVYIYAYQGYTYMLTMATKLQFGTRCSLFSGLAK